ncbi:MAG: hypothetical protein M2R45_02134 [Verrucomicrobia subdivision 3 bacterium]|nr:hypothetical protein [Limisphaerales bacterium]MCS1413711.1 hypothetical protein [Limisphaerales bacterium]
MDLLGNEFFGPDQLRQQAEAGRSRAEPFFLDVIVSKAHGVSPAGDLMIADSSCLPEIKMTLARSVDDGLCSSFCGSDRASRELGRLSGGCGAPSPPARGDGDLWRVSGHLVDGNGPLVEIHNISHDFDRGG